MIYRDKKSQYDQIEIKQELSKFINLLQSDIKSNQGESRQVEQILSKKLSVIMSASEPESSCLDKQNSNPSANRSFETGERNQNRNMQLFKILYASGLSNSQQKIVNQLKEFVDDILKCLQSKQMKIEQLRLQLEGQKKTNDDLLTVLMKLDREEKELWSNYELLNNKHQESLQINKLVERENQKMKEALISLQNDQDFMKKLIIHANQNYQALQKKCQKLEQLKQKRDINTDRKDMKKSSVDNLLKSAKTKKNSHSPSHSEVQHSPSRNQFQEIYRKMILRTLKFKGKQNIR